MLRHAPRMPIIHSGCVRIWECCGGMLFLQVYRCRSISRWSMQSLSLVFSSVCARFQSSNKPCLKQKGESTQWPTCETHACCVWAHPCHVTHTETTEYKLAHSAAEVLYRLLRMHIVHHTENHLKFLPVLLAMGHTDSRVLGVNCFMSSLKSVKSRDSGFSFRDLWSYAETVK